MNKKFLFSFVMSSLLILSAPAKGIELPKGEWVGWIQFDGQKNKFATKLDTIVYQPNDPDLFPKFEMLFRIGLGGFKSPEYFTQNFEQVNYDFDHGHISLDTAENDFVMSLIVSRRSGNVVLTGTVFSRASAVSGIVDLTFLTDEPDDGGDDTEPAPKPNSEPVVYAPTLAGQYEGRCDDQDAIFQISTARGLGEKLDPHFPGIKGYAVNARLGFDDPNLCTLNGTPTPGRKDWCTYRAFSSGEYNIADGSLTFSGWGGAPNCIYLDAMIQCSIRMHDVDRACSFKRVQTDDGGLLKPFTRKYFVNATSDQRRELPDVLPPDSSELIQALSGMYSGFLHHETLDLYQPMRLNVTATVSTDNPHNLNMVYISGATILHFDEPTSARPVVWSQRFERKAFYVKNGFTLDDHSSDSFIQIEQWKRGFVTGVLYSREFGRVGTIQLVKGAMPSIDSRAKMIANPLGSFSGPVSADPSRPKYWLIQTVGETQSTDLGKSTFTFRGVLENNGFVIPRQPIVSGSYDFFTQAIAFTTDDNGAKRIYSGHVWDSGLGLFMAGPLHFGIIVPQKHDELRFERQ